MEASLWVVLQFGVSFSFLAVGAIKDVLDHEVSNWLWLAFASVGGVLAFLEYGLSVLLGVHFLFAALISVAYYLIWTRFKFQIGGADVKAIMALGICLSYLAIHVVLYATIAVLVYAVYKAARESLTKKEILALKAPFIPFLFVGFLAATAVVFI